MTRNALIVLTLNAIPDIESAFFMLRGPPPLTAKPLLGKNSRSDAEQRVHTPGFSGRQRRHPDLR